MVSMSMEEHNSTSSSLVLFDHSMKDTHLDSNAASNSNNAAALHPPSSASNNTLFTQNSYPTSTQIISSNNFTTYLFFIFPIIGFIVLVMGSCLLRKRQMQQDAQAIQRYHERLSVAEAEKRLKEERRRTLVEKALITTKVTFMPKKPSFARRGRSSTMETDVMTVESSGDLDSTMSSSCTVLGTMMRRGSDEVSSIGGTIDEGGGRELSEEVADVEQGQQQQVDSSDSDSEAHQLDMTRRPAYETSTLPFLLENSPTPLDFQTELCAICLEPYRENDHVSYSKHQNCPHAFHSICILGWLQDEYRNDCPCCRGPYLHLCVEESDDDGYYNFGGGGSTNGGGQSNNGTDVNSRVGNGSSLATTSISRVVIITGTRMDITEVMDPTRRMDITEVMDPTSVDSASTAVTTLADVGTTDAFVVLEEEEGDSNV